MKFASRLFAWRQYRAWTQHQVAAAAGIPQPAVAALESGKLRPGLRRLVALENALNLEAGTLLAQSPPRPVWNRFQVDQLCRSLVSGAWADSEIAEESWLDFESLFRTRLRLANPRRQFRSRALVGAARRRLDARWGRDQVNLIDRRLRKWRGGNDEAV